MRTQLCLKAIAPIVLVALAGAAAPALAQNTAGSQPATIPAVRGDAEFRSWSWYSGRDVINNAGDHIADVSDLILDRGSGHTEYLVLKTGSILGLGGKDITIPYSAVRWDPAGEKIVLSSTEDELKQYPEFSADAWTGLKEYKKDDQNALRRRLSEDAARAQDPYATNLDVANRVRIEGEVKDVDRVSTANGQQVVLTVASKDGGMRKVAIGPSWFVNAAPVTPMRGDKVVIDAYALPRDPDQLHAATTLRVGDREEMRLRDTQGQPTWAMRTEATPESFNAPYWHYLLVSDLKGKQVDCRGVECGKVDDLVIDRRSGQLAMVSIDPNDNFLGIADTKRLVPWSVATVALDGTVRIDASKDMVLASPETPKDWTKVNSAVPTQVYRAYQVAPPRFDEPREVGLSPSNQMSDAWGHKGVILTSIDPSSSKTLSGKVVDTTKVTFSGDVKPAKAIRVSSADGEELVLVGPAWYMDNQGMTCKKGDTITMDVWRTSINGKDYWIAKSVDHNGQRVVLLDGDSPAWDRR